MRNCLYVSEVKKNGMYDGYSTFLERICEAKGFGNSFFKVMNCIEPAYQ